jgi:hypothetical protein
LERGRVRVRNRPAGGKLVEFVTVRAARQSGPYLNGKSHRRPQGTGASLAQGVEICDNPMSRCVLVVEDEVLVNMVTSGEIALRATRFAPRSAPMRRCGFWSNATISISFSPTSRCRVPWDGLKLAAVVSLRWPPIRILITTGKAAPRSDQMPAGSAFILKPYAAAPPTEATARDLRRTEAPYIYQIALYFPLVRRCVAGLQHLTLIGHASGRINVCASPS